MQLGSLLFTGIKLRATRLVSGQLKGGLRGNFFKSTDKRYAQGVSAPVSSSLSLTTAIVLGLCSMISSIPLHAQEFRGTITGQVTDSSGAALPSASVTAVSADTHQTYNAKSNAQGIYSLLYLLPGKYAVTVTAPQFQTNTYNVTVESAQQMGLNVTLQPGSVNERVVVTTTSGLLDTVSASTGGVVDQAKVENMPSSGREVWQDVGFTEGVRSLSNDPFDTTPRNNGDTFAVAGAPFNSNAFFLNGAPVSDQGKWYFAPNQDAVQQLQAVANAYDAQYGRTGGGSFNANVKDGTNKFHGTVYEYYGNEALNANSWNADLFKLKKGLNRRNTYGGVIGGPIRKDKTFFFGSFEGFRQTYPIPAVDSVPQLSWRNGDFSQSGFKIYDPLTTHCVKKNTSGQCSTYGRDEFPNDIIPKDRISPIGQAILAMYPDPTTAGDTNNYAISGARDFSYDQYIGRVDQNFSDKTRLYALFTLQKNGNHNPGNGFPNEATTATNPTGLDYNAILGVTRVLSSSMVADVKGSYGRYTTQNTTGVALQQNFQASKLGFNMPPVGSTSHTNVVPQFTVDSMSNLFGNTQNGNADADWDVNGSITQLAGRHNLHYGGEVMGVQSGTTGIPGTPNGSFAFKTNWTQNNPLARGSNDGVGIADILLGYPTSGNVSWNSNTTVDYLYYGAYIQDDFKVRPNLSLNVGLRWDVNTSPHEQHNLINAGFCLTCTNPYTSQINYAAYPDLQNPLLGGWLFAGVDGAPSAPFRVQWNDWQPRFGVSWGVTAKTVFRAGYGIFNTYPWLDTDANGFSQTTSYVDSLDGSLTPTPYFKAGNPYPDGAIAPTGSAGGLETQAGQAITYQNTDREIRKVQHWSVGIQRELPKSVLLDVQYIGSHATGLPVSTSIGTVSLAQQAACNVDNAICNNPVANPFYGVLPNNTTLGASKTLPAWELMRTYPLFNGVTASQVPSGTSDYHSLNVRVERRLKSLDFVVNYVYSNWMDQNSYLNNGKFRDAELWRGLDDNDRRHYFNSNVVLPLPIGQGGLVFRSAGGVLGAFVNNWLADSTLILESGTPLGIPSADFSGPGCTSYAPQGGQTRAHWLNNDVKCYHNLGSWEARTTPLQIGYLRNPGGIFWNFGAHKRFALPREGMFLQFRAEAVNAANHPTFNGPSLANNTPPSFTPGTGWVGFGTLPSSQNNAPRAIILSAKVIF